MLAGQRARASHQALAQVARAVFPKNTSQRAALGLTGSTPHTTAAFLATAYTLFDNALTIAAIGQVLASYGYDAARLGNERAVIVAFDQANQAQVAAIGAAQQATRDQLAALTGMNQWLTQYLKIAQRGAPRRPPPPARPGRRSRSSRPCGHSMPIITGRGDPRDRPR